MISIIIPVHNSELYLKECLDSVIKQTYKDFEVICVNDGSTDGSERIISEYKKRDYRFKYYVKDHTNAGEARNIGLKYASGEYLYFMDSDDVLVSTILEELIGIAKVQNPDIIIFQYQLFDNNTQTLSESVYGIASDHNSCNHTDLLETRKLDITNIAVWNKLYSAAFVRQYNIDFRSHSSLNDVYFSWVALMNAQCLVLHKKVGIYYRINSGNSISDNISQTSRIILDAFAEVNDYAICNNLWGIFGAILIVRELDQLSEFKERLQNTNQPELIEAFEKREKEFWHKYQDNIR